MDMGIFFQRYKWVLRVVGYIIAVVSLFFIAKQLWEAWPQLADLEISMLPALAALFFGCLSMIMHAFLWRTMLVWLGDALGLVPAIRIWFVSQLARYVPGKVWHFLGRAYLTQQTGVRPQVVGMSLLFELILTIAAALLVTVISFPFWQQYTIFGFWALLLIPLLVLVCWPHWLQMPIVWAFRRFRGQSVDEMHDGILLKTHDLFLLLPGYCLSWFFYGCGLYLLALSFYDIPLSAFPVITGGFGLAWVVGMLSFITPAGLGVREGVLGFLLSLVMPEPVALLLALLARVWLTLAELVCIAVLMIVPGKIGMSSDYE